MGFVADRRLDLHFLWLLSAAPVALCILAVAGCMEGAPIPNENDSDMDGRIKPDDVEDISELPTPNIIGLTISPSEFQLVLSEAADINQDFVVEVTYSDGTARDITHIAEVNLLDASLGVITRGQLMTAQKAGATRLRASWQGVVAEASVTVSIHIEDVIESTMGVPDNAISLFSGTSDDVGRQAPEIVYPFDGTMFPPNLKSMDVHFLPNDVNHTLFKINIDSTYTKLDLITRCEVLNEGCIVNIPQIYWSMVSRSAAGRSPVVVSVDAANDLGPGLVAGPSIRFELSPEKVEGGLYYWTTTSPPAIMRVDFGNLAEPEVFLRSETSGGNLASEDCVGCHSLSPNGQFMSVSYGGQGLGFLSVIDVGTRAPQVARDQSLSSLREQFQSWGPDSKQFAGTWEPRSPTGVIRIRDGISARVLEEIALENARPTHIDWSPSGDRIAFTNVAVPVTAQRSAYGGIAYIKRDLTGWRREVHELIASEVGKSRYTPAYAPSGEFLLYGQSQCSDDLDVEACWVRCDQSDYPPFCKTENCIQECDGDADPSSKLWAIRADGGAPIELKHINEKGPTDVGEMLSITFPKWAPFVDTMTAEGEGSLMWVTFSARRRVGLRSNNGANQLLWMAAVNPQKILQGEDGSYRPFVLPFQDFNTSNHLAQWTQRIVDESLPAPVCLVQGQSCEASPKSCCSGLSCREGAGESRNKVCIVDA